MFFISYIGNALWYTLLFILVGVLPWIIVAFIMQLLSNSIRKSLASLLGIQGYIYLTCPGVMVHEIGHALFCIIFRHKIIDMKLFSPEADGTLGYVNHSYKPKSFYQRIGNFFIGTGPVWFGIVMLYLVSWLLLPNEMSISDFFSADFWSRWQSYCWLYLILTISSHVTLSQPDLAGASRGAGVLVASVFLFELAFGWCEVLNSHIDSILHNVFVNTSSILGLFLLITLLLAIVLMIFVKKRCR